MFERILVPLDGSALAEQALPFARDLAAAFHARVTLLRAIPSAEQAFREVASETATNAPELTAGVARARFESEQTAAQEYLDRQQKELEAGGLTVETAVIEGDPEWAIKTHAAAINASLIVMASHGRGGLGRLVFGSVADNILRESTVPVLLIRPQG